MEAENSCCSECLIPYDDVIPDTLSQMDSFGEDSLTEQQQAFLEQIFNNKVPDRCPMCME